ncbi:MAG: hypothetical protein K940chlam9_01623 [Chlamydiae bacterium]|nr:hypothetical protein [Chlamydiota bacterium]
MLKVELDFALLEEISDGIACWMATRECEDRMIEFVQCYCLPQLSLIGISLGYFVLAVALWWAGILLVGRIFRKEGFAKSFLRAIRYPSLLLLLCIAGFASVSTLELTEGVAASFRHVLVVVVIAAVGWFVGKVLSACYQFFLKKVLHNGQPQVARRTIITQLLYFYRFAQFVLVVLTVSVILMTFPYIRSLGVGLLGSAGIAGLALGIAARPILLNLMAGFQIAATKTIKIDDAVFVEGEFGRVESIHLTHVVVATWDMRRIILPISYFIDKPFQNWDAKNPEVLSSFFLYCDYTVPVEEIRKKTGAIIESCPHWNKNLWKLHVTDFSEQTVQIRIIATADDTPTGFELRAYIREKLIDYIQRMYPQALPCIRYKQ